MGKLVACVREVVLVQDIHDVREETVLRLRGEFAGGEVADVRGAAAGHAELVCVAHGASEGCEEIPVNLIAWVQD